MPDLRLWATTVTSHDLPSLPGVDVRHFTIPLRCAPHVLEELRPALERAKAEIKGYASDSGVPAPGDGLQVKRLRHGGQGHTAPWPPDCRQCGRKVARVLRNFGVGSTSKVMFLLHVLNVILIRF